MDPTKPWLSKTVIVNFLFAAAAFFPGFEAWAAAHPQVVVAVPVVVNIVLRFVTKQPLEFPKLS